MSAAIFGTGGGDKVYIAHAWDWHLSAFQDKMDLDVGTLKATIDNDILMVCENGEPYLSLLW